MSILDTENAQELKETATSVLQTLLATPEENRQAVINTVGFDAMFRLALIEPQIAQMSIPYLINNISLMHRKWLLISFRLGIEARMYQVEKTVIEAPSFSTPERPYIAKLLQLHLHWPELQQQIDNEIFDSLGDEKNQFALQIDVLQENALQSNLFFPSFLNKPVIPGSHHHIKNALSGYSTEILEWFYMYCCLFSDFDLDQIIPQEQKTTLQNLLNNYDRNDIIFYLKSELKSQNQHKALDTVEHIINSHIKRLSFNTKRWLYITSMIEVFVEENEDRISLPQGEQSNFCADLQRIAYNCPILCQRIRYQLEDELGEEEINNLFKYIAGYLNTNSKMLPDETKLWLALCLSLRVVPNHFNLIPVGIHERTTHDYIQGDPTIFQLQPYFRMASYSSSMMLRIVNTLTNGITSEVTKEKADNIESYIKKAIQDQIAVLSGNGLKWLYFALALNMQHSNPIRLTDNHNLTKPTGDELARVEHILNATHYNPDLIKLYLTEIQHKMESQNFQMLETITKNYILAHLRQLSLTAQKSLYWILTTYSYHPVYHTTEIESNIIHKLTFILGNNTNLHQYCLKQLRQNPEIAALKPERKYLSNMVLRHGDLSDLIYHAILSDDMTDDISLHIMHNISPKVKKWLGRALHSGNINIHDLVQTYQGYNNLQMSQELKALTSLIIAALYNPYVRQKIIRRCIKIDSPAQAVTQVCLDGLPLGDKGAIALSMGLKKHKNTLQALSLNKTEITDIGFEALNKHILTHRNLAHLQLINNQISIPQIKSLINTLYHTDRENSSALCIPFLTSLLNNNFVLGSLSARIKTQRMKPNIRFDLPMYHPELNSFMYDIADFIYECHKDSPEKIQIIEEIIDAKVQNFENNHQLIYAAVNSNDQELISLVLDLTLSGSDQEVQDWAKEALITGKLIPPYLADDPDHKKLNQILQLTCLLTASNVKIRHELFYKYFNTTIRPSNTITEINIKEIVVPTTLKASLIHALSINNDTIKSVTLDNVYLYDNEVKELCLATKDKSNLETINLSRNPLNNISAINLAKLISSNKNIKKLDFSDSIGGEPAAITLINSLCKSGLESLTLNHNALWETQQSIGPRGVSALIEALNNPSCPLVHLDISDNKINSYDAKRLLQFLRSNRNLQSLKLNGIILGDVVIQALAELVKDNPTLKEIEIDLQNCTLETLKILNKSLDVHHAVISLKLKPDVMVSLPTNNDNNMSSEQTMQSYLDTLSEIERKCKSNKVDRDADLLSDTFEMKLRLSPFAMNRTQSDPCLLRTRGLTPPSPILITQPRRSPSERNLFEPAYTLRKGMQ